MKKAYICPCCESNPADITNESDIINMICVKCGPIAIRKNQKKTLKEFKDISIIDNGELSPHTIYNQKDFPPLIFKGKDGFIHHIIDSCIEREYPIEEIAEIIWGRDFKPYGINYINKYLKKRMKK